MLVPKTSNAGLRLSAIAQQFRLVHEKAARGHPFGQIHHWLWCALLSAVIADKAAPIATRTEVLNTLVSASALPMRIAFCNINSKAQRSWKKNNHKQHTMTIVVPPELVHIWFSVRNVLRIQGCTVHPMPKLNPNTFVNYPDPLSRYPSFLSSFCLATLAPERIHEAQEFADYAHRQGFTSIKDLVVSFLCPDIPIQVAPSTSELQAKFARLNKSESSKATNASECGTVKNPMSESSKATYVSERGNVTNPVNGYGVVLYMFRLSGTLLTKLQRTSLPCWQNMAI